MEKHAESSRFPFRWRLLASLAILSALGETINLMTLGGLALAVGILVDDATVTIENIERHLSAGETLENGILIGAGEIALPAMVSTFCICIVFVPMFFLAGVAGFLFAPLAKAVVLQCWPPMPCPAPSCQPS